MQNTEGSEHTLTAALFENMAEPVLLCDQSLTIRAVNEAAAELLGIPASQLIGRSAWDALPQCQATAPDPPPPASGRLEWRSEFRAPGGRRRLLEISGVGLNHGRSGARGWALALNVGQSLEPPAFIGNSAVVQELLEFVSRIAASRTKAILLAGESGTGKELIAKRLHCLSGRVKAPFVPINCAALPESLLESELFGHERGAFTDAGASREGLLETAHGGTVFLDEVGEMPVRLQAKLLRVLEDHTFRRVGGSRDIAVDLRVISATNADLETAIEGGRFRRDLYYRLNIVQIRLPALRERPEDIRALAAHFLDHFNRVHHRQIRGIDPAALRILESCSWPGNVRELRNIMERAVLVETSSLITMGSLAIPNPAGGAASKFAHGERTAFSARLSLRGSEQELIAAALAETNGNQTRAAWLLGIGRFCLRYRMKRLGML
jgi:transcriptional regulator with PAS, ATPase and Fis domain